MRFPPAVVSPLEGGPEAFGTMYHAQTGIGIDPARVGYVEGEFLLSGRAGMWRTGAPGSPQRCDEATDYRTRILVRRPRDPAQASGVTHLEPLHPHMDAGLTWDGLAPHLIRRGDAWVGVTVFPDVVRIMRESVNPARYEALSVPGAGTEWDILSDALEAVRDRRLGPLQTTAVILSGWSATGSVCRVFARERFATARGGLVDAVGIFISSGGAGRAGYPALSPTAGDLDLEDPRRTMRDAGVPVFEILSETESETHRAQLRDDSDEPGDTYRLYQLAGSAHIENHRHQWSTNAAMLAAAGRASGDIDVQEPRTDARTDLVMRSLLDHLIAGVDGTPAPRAPRFDYARDAAAPALALRRDRDGNVVGGIRTPWAQVPLAAYTPHGTPTADDRSPAAPDWTPLVDRALAAGLIGTMRPFTAADVQRRYGDEASYRRRFDDATRRLVEDGLLLAEDADELLATVPQRWDAAMREEGTHG